ncbi:stc1 domain-containing protein [Pochonia chlamydosporia 170]|uniref:Stc1 domain-containing protein n=1 Tax=Pochonia chlamydosporia 170 TaxID=1380566 RepID=A0A179G038_METCM|nr:stc1 domain-containing protein [Pochonia chlamydosporia 170]OAQ71027.1 stc1 domain-containing protein [Pochonia chlamydosporia 170]
MGWNQKQNQGTNLGSQSAVPSRYRCKVGGEWRPLQDFSKNQQKLIQRQASQGIDAANSGMTCIEHSATNRRELRCDLCQLIKPLDAFSKSMRKSDDPMCLRCTAWSETQEPGVTPTHLETGHISVEERDNSLQDKRHTESTDFFPDDSMPRAPITALSSLGITISDAPSKIASLAGSQRYNCAPSRGPSSVVSVPRSDVLPPHVEARLAGLKKKGGLSLPSDSDLESQDLGSCSAPSDVQARPKIPYNAWDNTGKYHEAEKTPTASHHGTSSTSTYSNTQAVEPDTAGGWEDAPATTMRWPEPKKGWHKAPRLERSPPKGTDHVSKVHVDPIIDQQRRKNYCASDDSRY